MKNHFLFSLILCILILPMRLSAQTPDSLSNIKPEINPEARNVIKDTVFLGVKVSQKTEKWDEYHPELGYFQRAYSDKGDPRFMFTSEDNNFEFGVGGQLRITAFTDFNGSVYHNRFSTWEIPVPTDKSIHTGINVATSKVFFKGRAKFGKHKLISFLQLGSNESNQITLSQAYFSYGGFTVGKVYSFFMDLTAGVQTVDLRGPNTGVDQAHALIGYTAELGKNIRVGFSAESPDFHVTQYERLGICEESQNIPDFAAMIKWKAPFGHLQLSGLIRSLSYWSYDTKMPDTWSKAEVDKSHGSTKHSLGIGGAFSGRVNINPNLFFTFQTIFGKGIQQYIEDYADTNMDLVPTRINAGTNDEHYNMKTLPLWGGYLGAQYNVNDKLSCSAIFGIVSMDIKPIEKFSWVHDTYTNFESDCKYYDYKHTSYLAINAFYHLNNYCTIGFEYLNGLRWQRDRTYDPDNFYPLTGKTNIGVANRIDMMFSYAF